MCAWGCSSDPDAPPPTDPDAATLLDGSPDGSSEATVTPPNDASADVNADSPSLADGGTGYCATHLGSPLFPTIHFCADFDESTDLKSGFDQDTVLNGEPIRDTTTSTSAPASFAAVTDAVPDGEGANVHFRVTSKGVPVGHVVLSFSVKLETTTFMQGAVAIATLDVSDDHFFTLYLRNRNLATPTASLEEDVQGSAVDHVLSKLPAEKVWTRVSINVDLASSKASVMFGADKVLDGVTIMPTPTPSDPTIRVGAVYIFGPADPFAAHFDDITLEY